MTVRTYTTLFASLILLVAESLMRSELVPRVHVSPGCEAFSTINCLVIKSVFKDVSRDLLILLIKTCLVLALPHVFLRVTYRRTRRQKSNHPTTFSQLGAALLGRSEVKSIDFFL